MKTIRVVLVYFLIYLHWRLLLMALDIDVETTKLALEKIEQIVNKVEKAYNELKAEQAGGSHE